ncbi:hypothetical protein Hdeb2414_s0007g00238171 [Helianthus debilis subsp. tardiflorus]
MKVKRKHVFVPFAFDTFGALAPDAVRFLKRVQQVVSSNTAHVKGQNFVFSRVGFAIQKGVAAQLVARLPTIGLFVDGVLQLISFSRSMCLDRLAVLETMSAILSFILSIDLP